MAGLVHIYTGNGKGKTTSAVGLGIRAYGRGKKVLMIQFLKGSQTGEILAIEKLGQNFEICRNKKIKKFSWNMDQEDIEEMKKNIDELFQYAVSHATDGKFDMIILDEIIASITKGFISIDEVINFVNNKSSKIELVMTGRNAPQELIRIADYVSEINEVKHPFAKGIPAREGIEY